MSSETRRLPDAASAENVSIRQLKIFTAPLVCKNEGVRTATIDVEATTKIQGVGEFTNTESTNN